MYSSKNVRIHFVTDRANENSAAKPVGTAMIMLRAMILGALCLATAEATAWSPVMKNFGHSIKNGIIRSPLAPLPH